MQRIPNTFQFLSFQLCTSTHTTRDKHLHPAELRSLLHAHGLLIISAVHKEASVYCTSACFHMSVCVSASEQQSLRPTYRRLPTNIYLHFAFFFVSHKMIHSELLLILCSHTSRIFSEAILW